MSRPFSFFFLSLFFFSSLSVSLPAHAAVVEVGGVVSFSGEESVSENLYAVGEHIAISTPLLKDATLVGGQVIVDAPVSGDITAVGGVIHTNATVSGDVRSVGGEVVVGGEVGGDVVVVAGSVTILPSARVLGEVIIFAGSASLLGSVEGGVLFGGAELTLGGEVAGEVNIPFVESITISPDIQIGGSLAYSSQNETSIPETAMIGGGVKYSAFMGDRANEEGAHSFFSVSFFVLLLMYLSTVAFTVLVFRHFSQVVTAAFFEKVAIQTGVGLLFLIVVPIISLLLFISVLGAVGGVALLVGYMAFFLVAYAMSGIIVGSYIARLSSGTHSVSLKWAMIGSLLFFLLTSLPIVGWVIMLLTLLSIVGSLCFLFYHFVAHKHQ